MTKLTKIKAKSDIDPPTKENKLDGNTTPVPGNKKVNQL